MLRTPKDKACALTPRRECPQKPWHVEPREIHLRQKSMFFALQKNVIVERNYYWIVDKQNVLSDVFFHVFSLVNLKDNIQKNRKTPQKHVVLSLQKSICLFVEKGWKRMKKTKTPEILNNKYSVYWKIFKLQTKYRWIRSKSEYTFMGFEVCHNNLARFALKNKIDIRNKPMILSGTTILERHIWQGNNTT